MAIALQQRQTQTVLLAPQLRQGLRLLAMGTTELRQEILREMSQNPVIDESDGGQEETVAAPSVEECEAGPETYEGNGMAGENDADFLSVAYMRGFNRDRSSPEAMEARERFFNNQVATESLEAHLLDQLPVADIDEADYPLAEMLIGELDGDGYFRGSLGDMARVSGESEGRLRGLLKKISLLDPPGCGATSLKECLLPQLDSIADRTMRERVRGLLNRLPDLAAVRRAAPDVLAALRSLDPRPGRQFRKAGYECEHVRPEVRAVPYRGGYRAVVDDRELPTIRISQRCLDLLENPKTDEATKAYVRERLASVQALMDAVEHRQDTIAAITQAIFDAQPGFFRDGMSALKPLTMQQIADKVGVHHTTVSRTVRGKYVATPKGTVELRRFFTSAVETDGGEAASVTTVLLRLREMVNAEDLSAPLSDDLLARRLKSQGYDVARRTVSKYRTRLGIPPAAKRAVRRCA